jgi:hypothetical protein
MENSVWGGILLAMVMIFIMFLPNYLFKTPGNYDDIRAEYLKDMKKLSKLSKKKKYSKDDTDT